MLFTIYIKMLADVDIARTCNAKGEMPKDVAIIITIIITLKPAKL